MHLNKKRSKHLSEMVKNKSNWFKPVFQSCVPVIVSQDKHTMGAKISMKWLFS